MEKKILDFEDLRIEKNSASFFSLLYCVLIYTHFKSMHWVIGKKSLPYNNFNCYYVCVFVCLYFCGYVFICVHLYLSVCWRLFECGFFFCMFFFLVACWCVYLGNFAFSWCGSGKYFRGRKSIVKKRCLREWTLFSAFLNPLKSLYLISHSSSL